MYTDMFSVWLGRRVGSPAYLPAPPDTYCCMARSVRWMDRGGLVLVRLAGRHIYPIPLRTSYYGVSVCCSLPLFRAPAYPLARLFTRSHKITRMLASLCVKVCWGSIGRCTYVWCLTVTISVNVEGCKSVALAHAITRVCSRRRAGSVRIKKYSGRRTGSGRVRVLAAWLGASGVEPSSLGSVCVCLRQIPDVFACTVDRGSATCEFVDF
jgi:hypothetical protein